jgi:hypothetical protein
MGLSVIETGRDVSASRAAVEDRSSRLIEQLKKIGVEKQDISSSELRVVPHYNWSNKEQVYTGTEVSREVEVALRDLGKYSELMKIVFESGVGRITSTRLEASEEKALKRKALERSLADAKSKAQAIADDLGVALGRVYSVVAGAESVGFARAAEMDFRAARGKTSFEPGTIQFRESVKVVYFISED